MTLVNNTFISFRKLGFLFLFLFLIHFSFSQSESSQSHILQHEVKEGETAYSIAKKYGQTPEELRKNNPSIPEDFTLSQGQVLIIPFADLSKIKEISKEVKKTPIFHEVAEKQTLFSLNQLYNVPIDSIKDWNQLTDNSIKVGQKLIIGWSFKDGKGQEVLADSAPNETSSPSTNYNTKSAKTSFYTSKQSRLQERFEVRAQQSGVRQETGPAIWFTTDNDAIASRYYGLFDNVGVGTVVRVTNLVNNRSVYVKIIGQLPDTAENHGAMIKLTTAAKQALNTKDGKIRVEVEFPKQ